MFNAKGGSAFAASFAYLGELKGGGGVTRKSLRPIFGRPLHPTCLIKAMGGQESAEERPHLLPFTLTSPI